MKNLIRLTKINLLTIFDFYTVKNANNFNEKKKALGKFLVILIAFGYLGYYLYTFAKTTITGLNMMGMANALLPAFMAMASVYVLFTTIFKVNKTIFDSKDYSILLSLPIKKSAIIASKVLLLYIFNIIYSTLFMLPAYIAYTYVMAPTATFHVIYWISFFLVPMAPTVIGALIGSLLTGISSKFKYKNIASILISIIFFVLVMYGSYATGGMSAADFAKISNNIVELFNKYYPLTKLYSMALDGSFLDLLIYVGISVGLFEFLKYFVSYFFDRVNSNLAATTIINKYNDKDNKVNSSFNSLFKKEVKKYFSSSLYVMNTGIGVIMLTIGTIALVIVGPKSLEGILEIKGIAEMISKSAPLVVSFLAALTCTTYPSISLEGKNLWILKQLPISPKNIFNAKILLNLVVTIPFVIINSVILSLYLDLSLVTFLIMLFTPITFSIFISGFGLLINLLIPDFNWSNEVKPIKQSAASFITILSGMILAMIPLTLKLDINSDLYSFLIGCLMIVLSIIVYYILYTYGQKRFRSL